MSRRPSRLHRCTTVVESVFDALKAKHVHANLDIESLGANLAQAD